MSFSKYIPKEFYQSVLRELDHVQCDWEKLTHQCRIIPKAKNSRSVPINGCPDLLRTSSGILDHINSLSRFESFLSHLARENLAHICRHESRVFLSPTLTTGWPGRPVDPYSAYCQKTHKVSLSNTDLPILAQYSTTVYVLLSTL